MDSLDSTNPTDPFIEAETYLRITLPSAMKKIFIMNGYDNIQTIGNINEEDIAKTETFARSTLHEVIDEHELSFYYGIFKNHITKFKFLDGHKKQLYMVIEYYKSQNKKRKSITPPESQLELKTKKKMSMKNTETHLENTSIEPCNQQRIIRGIILNVDLAEEKKSILGNICEWVKQKCKSSAIDQEMKDKIISCQLVSVSLSNQTESENNEECENNVQAIITCFCECRTKVIKTFLKGKKNRKWILSNYYRHLTTHLQTKTQNKFSKKVQPNSLKNYFSTVDQNTNKAIITSPETTLIIQSTSIEMTDEQLSSSPSCSYSTSHSTKQLDKWRNPKYSRTEREKRAREKSLIEGNGGQLLITNFYKFVRDISICIEQNKSISELMVKQPNLESTNVEKMMVSSPSSFLNALCQASLNNSKNNKSRNRYTDQIKQFSVYLYFVGGRLLYETLQGNLKNSLPTISSLYKFLSMKKDIIVEGEYRIEQLKKYLTARNLPLCVWISEDATRISGKIEYDSVTNKIIGFVMPFENGIAKVGAFEASSAITIVEYFQNNYKSDYAYVIMAQPLAEKAPPFCLSIFGTDNRFTHADVISRWNIINDLALKAGIQILGYSSDGDTRLLKSMQIEANKNDSSLNISYVQDTVHICTKLRTRLLKPSVFLPIGNYEISVTHLRKMAETVSKDKHLLTVTDLSPEDKMNFHSAEKICSPKVIELLMTIPENKGTVEFLKMMNYVLSSYLDKKISIQERIYRIWHSVYLLRIWRNSILNSKEYTLKDNFITTNAYSCIELNAASLVKLVKHFRNADNNLKPNMFLPWHFSSQACEQLFRTTRSMTSTYSTVVNFSLKDILHRLSRIEVLNCIQNDLQNQTTETENFNFPRLEKHNRNYIYPDTNSVDDNLFNSTINLIEEIEIDQLLLKSLSDAKAVANSLGIKVEKNSWLQPKYLLNYANKVEGINNLSFEKNKSNEIETRDIQLHLTESQLVTEVPDDVCSDLCDISQFGNFGEGLHIKDYSKSSQYLKIITDNENHQKVNNASNINTEFVCVTVNNKDLIIKKSSLCWLLDNKSNKISNDRLRRFINNSKQNKVLIKKNTEITQESKMSTKNINSKKIEVEIDSSSEDIDDPSNELCDNKLSDYNTDDLHEEVQYQTPIWKNIKPGTYLLVQFVGSGSASCRKSSKFSYVCCVSRVDDEDGEIIVQGMQKEKSIGVHEGTQFCMKDNDMSSISIEMVVAILPEPKLLHKSRKLVYEFPGCVSVKEK